VTGICCLGYRHLLISQIKVPLKFLGLQTELSLFEIVSKVGVVNIADITVLFRKSGFFWVKRENTADKKDFQNLCCQFVCHIACQLIYLFLDGLGTHIVSGVFWVCYLKWS